MALTNRITGESLDQEILHNQQAAQTEAPTLSEPPSELNETPAQPKPRRKKSSPDETSIPPHTQLYLMEQAEAQIRRLIELGDRMEAMLKETQNNATEKNAIEGSDCERTVDELVAKLGQSFDDRCRLIFEQRLSDAQKESERLCGKLSRAGSKVNGLRRWLIGTAVISTVSLLVAAVTVFILLTR